MAMVLLRRVALLCVAGLLVGSTAGALGAGATVTGSVVTPLPAVQGPLATTATSYPWGAAAHGLTPIDLAAYTEGRRATWPETDPVVRR